VGAISEASAYPDDFRKALDDRAGFWPGRADYSAFGPNDEHPEIYLEQSDRLTEFLARAALLAASRTDWDLLFIYFSEVDAVEHHFLLVDPRQAGYTPERSKRFAGFIDHAYADADRVIAQLEALLTPRDALFVTSDHGMTPLRLEVYPNEILKRAGLVLTAAKTRDSFDPSTPVAALATSGIAHVYVNPAAPTGTLDVAERTLREYRLPDGESPWDRVARREDAGPLSLDAPESGDLLLLAKPGIGLSTKLPGFAEGPSEEYGGHGYRAAFRDLDATFLAAGPGVPHVRVAEISSTTIAARIAAALGISRPSQAAPIAP
jgi:predicted AlkP superfamily pyrophosphatase or phosphodiesterase